MIRCGCTGNTSADLIVSGKTFFGYQIRLGSIAPVPGSYDKTVRVWDAREGKETMQLEHGWPVESVLLFPNDALLVSAGKPVGSLRKWMRESFDPS